MLAFGYVCSHVKHQVTPCYSVAHRATFGSKKHEVAIFWRTLSVSRIVLEEFQPTLFYKDLMLCLGLLS